MPRLRSLLSELRGKFPDDSYLKHHDLKISESLVLRRLQNSYERALATLDAGAWEALREKATRNFTLRENVRGKQTLFDHLNEAFAYRFLLRSGYKDISFVDDTVAQKKKGQKVRCPDLRFARDGLLCYCEVKTINVSDAQLNRERVIGVVHDSSIFDLGDPFFAKLDDTIAKKLSVNSKLPLQAALRAALGRSDDGQAS